MNAGGLFYQIEKCYNVPMKSHITPKDFFLHLGAAAVLYVAVGSLINLSFSIINYFKPDTLAGYFYSGSIAWPISMLVVLVPILYILEWIINRDIKNNPEKIDIWIRKWRIYLTLFLAVILMASDLIVLLNTYLNGEITSRFVYKVIVILLLAGSVGKYYFYSLFPKFKPLGNMGSKFNWAKMVRLTNAWFGILFTLTVIVTGFIIVGSPAKQRSLRFDQQRINDLSSIQSTILYNSWQVKGVLPNTLSELNDSLSGFNVPMDPETDIPYGYTKKSSTTFELCATFGQPSQDTKGRGSYDSVGMSVSRSYYPDYPGFDNEQWEHEAGLTCFERTIDPERYPVNPKPTPKEIAI